MHTESVSCYNEWKKNGVIVQRTAHGNLVCWDHAEQIHSHVLEDRAAKSQRLEFVHETSPLCQTSHLGHNKWQPQKERHGFLLCW
jgi:hypothetical protein